MTRSQLPAELTPEQVTAVIDAREQIPFSLAPLQTIRGTLATGDYSVAGLEDVIALERKSLADLICCVTGERERFQRELIRLLGYPTRAVIIEASWADLERGNWRSKVTPAAVVASITSWIGLGIPFVMAGDRRAADEAAAKILFYSARRRWRECRSFAKGVLAEGGGP